MDALKHISRFVETVLEGRVLAHETGTHSPATDQITQGELFRRKLLFEGMMGLFGTMLVFFSLIVVFLKTGRIHVFYLVVNSKGMFWKGRPICCQKGAKKGKRCQKSRQSQSNGDKVPSVSAPVSESQLSQASIDEGEALWDEPLIGETDLSPEEKEARQLWEEKQRQENWCYLKSRRVILTVLFWCYCAFSICIPFANSDTATCKNGFFWETHMPFFALFFFAKGAELVFFLKDPTAPDDIGFVSFGITFFPSFMSFARPYTDAVAIVIASHCHSESLPVLLTKWMLIIHLFGVFFMQWLIVAATTSCDPSQACLMKLLCMDTLASCTSIPEDKKWIWNFLHMTRSIAHDLPHAFVQTLFVIYVYQNMFMIANVILAVATSAKAVYDAVNRTVMAPGAFELFLEHAGGAFNLEKWSVQAKIELRGTKIVVWKIGGSNYFKFSDRLHARMNELGIEWQEIYIDPGPCENPMAGSPAISEAWAKVVHSGQYPDLIWECGGRLSEEDLAGLECTHIGTCNSNILYYMNDVTMYAPKAGDKIDKVCTLMQVFDDIPAATRRWRNECPSAFLKYTEDNTQLTERFIAATMSIETGNWSRLSLLSHSRSNFQRDIHQKQFQTRSTVARSYPICIWGNSHFAIVTGIISQRTEHMAGNKDVLSIWLKEGDEWMLLSMTNDPVNTEESAIGILGGWAKDMLAPFSGSGQLSQCASEITWKDASDGERFGSYCWRPPALDGDFVQVAEFHYGRSSRLFFLDRYECSVSGGLLWSTDSMWTLRIWSIQNGLLSISEGIDFMH